MIIVIWECAMKKNCLKVGLFAAILGIGGLFLRPAMVMAQEEIEVETTKLATEDAPTTAAGELEIEVGYGRTEASRYFDQNNHLKNRKVALNNEVGAKATYGILDNLDASVTYGWASLIDSEEEAHDGQGSGDTGLGVKWNFYSCEECGVSLSYYPSIIFPTGESGTSARLGVSQEYYSADQLLVLTYVNGAFTMNVDSGYVLPFGDEREDSRGDYLGDVAFGYQLKPWLQPEVELNYTHGYVHDDTDYDSLAITAGFIMNVAENWRIDLGAQQALYGRNSDSYTSVLVNFSHTFSFE